MRVLTASLAALAVTAINTQAFDTDRPDITKGSSVVGNGVLQIESGLNYREQEVNDQAFDQLELFDTLLRFGLSDTLEVRLGWDGYISRERSGVSTEKGPGDASLGAKLFVHEETRSFGEASIIGQITLPTGDDEFTSDGVDPSIVVAVSHTLKNDYSLGYQVGVGLETLEDATGEEESESSLLYNVALGRTCTEFVDAFIGINGAFGLSAETDPSLFNAGVSVLVLENVKVDATLGAGLSDDAEDWIVGIGVSYRQP